MIQVLLAIPHPQLVLGLQELLEMEADIRVVATADTKERAVALIEELQPQVVIWDSDDIDSYMSPDLELLTRLGTTQPHMVLLVVVGFPLSYYDNRLLQVGAAGYIQKEEVSTHLLGTVKAIAASRQQ
jgi:DNA-binding NarL/FixJ family response regulator